MEDLAEQMDFAGELRRAIEAEDEARLDQLLDPLPPSEALRLLLNLGEDLRDDAFRVMAADLAAELVEEAPSELAADFIGSMDAERAAEVLDELGSDVQADVIGELKTSAADAVLAEMDDEDAADVRRLVEYDEDTAGGLMSTEVFAFAATATVGSVIRRIADEEDEFDRYRAQNPYVVDEEGRLTGVISLRALLASKRASKLSQIMVSPITVTTDASLDALEDLFIEHSFLAVPVLDELGRLTGVVTRASVTEALAERAESQSLRRQGVIGDELRSMPLRIRSGRRLAWLSANIVLNIIAASVISAYEETLAAVIAIAVFLPMVSDMSGCSGNQAVGVTMRELSLGLVRPVDALRVWLKEISVGVVNGIALGILIGLVAWFWKGNPWLGLVIGLALAINTVIAVSIGGVVPLLLKRLGQDPAVASGPLLTTITDMAGFFLVLSLATLMMPYLI
ncbi:magnesium transporter [Aliiruegeria sabulilitoris]|uniref:magnesium transporter n=1 Tax=Aliiruegeria sabulilitoris TaxID=1510458 RepID=UPI0008310D8C|nr:magnesium transporter [Aliiruegeria sabulilitoris]NDR59735.1 magnesium transporter [Pseudoruegeria sp. M32A2M]